VKTKTSRNLVLVLVVLFPMFGSPTTAFADFWEAVGRVAAGVVTGGWSEVVFNLIDAVQRAVNDIHGQLDAATWEAKNEVQTAINGQASLVATAEQRVTSAATRGQQAAHAYLLPRSLSDKGRGQNLATSGSKAQNPATAKAPSPGKINFGQAKPGFADDATVIRQAETQLLAGAQEFRALTAEIRRILSQANAEADSHIAAIKTDFAKEIFTPLDDLLTTLIAAIPCPVCGADYFAMKLNTLSDAAGSKLVRIEGGVTGLAYDEINAANVGRVNAPADWAEKFSGLIVTATGSGPQAAQAMIQLRHELGLPRPLSLNMQAKATMNRLPSSSGGIGGKFPENRAHLQGAYVSHFNEAKRQVQLLSKFHQRIDERLVQSVDSYLENQFKGKSPQQILAAKSALMGEAKQRFASQPKQLQIVELFISQRAAGRKIGVAAAVRQSGASKSLNPQPLPPKAQLGAKSLGR